MTLIDPPNAFSSRDEWQAFLDDMEKLAKDRPDDKDVLDALKLARENIRDAK